jgi:type IV pilus assembly protein PilX
MNRLICIAGVNDSRQRGATLIVTMLMLVLVLLLGIAAAQIALQGEKTSRNDRDRQIAFQAAEAALLDAETDIEASPHPGKSRSRLFDRYAVTGFPADDNTCTSGTENIYLGLCRPAPEGVTPIWQTVDFLDASAHAHSVPYGQFTGHVFPTAGGSLPMYAPRYIIELISDKSPGLRADRSAYLYRITAVGFGPNERTQVALQTIYRKAH